MKTCNECECHIEVGVKEVAFFYHVCTYKLIKGIGKGRIICEKGEEPYVPDWCPKEAAMNCKYLLDGKGVGRACVKDENCSCRYWGMNCKYDEEDMRANMGQDSKLEVIFNDDDGYPD